MELIGVALRLASFVAQRFKHSLCVRRPHEYSPQVQPVITTPGAWVAAERACHAGFRGRTTPARLQATAAANPPTALLTQQLMAQAARIAINRTWPDFTSQSTVLPGRFLGWR